MISKRYNAQMGNYLAKLAQEQNNLGTWQESIIKEYKTKQTNADRIRSMTDEELADFITDDICELLCGAPLVCEGQCKQKMLDWLKEEVSTDGN